MKVEKTLEIKGSEQSEAGSFCSQRLLLQTSTSFDTFGMFNMSIPHCNIICMTENKKKRNRSPLINSVIDFVLHNFLLLANV